MDTGKSYYDSDGNECSIWQVVRREPDWAASRIQEGEEAIEKVEQLKQENEELLTEIECEERRFRGLTSQLCEVVKEREELRAQLARCVKGLEDAKKR